jgi:hypothetical protein
VQRNNRLPIQIINELLQPYGQKLEQLYNLAGRINVGRWTAGLIWDPEMGPLKNETIVKKKIWKKY